MPDSRSHRGAHPSDAQLFTAATLPALRAATAELSWLLSHGYTSGSAVKLVGDRHQLRKRQRDAVLRAACSDASLTTRERKLGRIKPEDELWIDGFNVLLTLEVALGQGVVLACRDGCLRDIASVHGTYRSVHETNLAIALLGSYLQALRPSVVHVVLDAPVSNSGRLKTAIEHAWVPRFAVRTHLVNDADRMLIDSATLVASADSQVLDACDSWVNLAHDLVTQELPAAWVVELG